MSLRELRTAQVQGKRVLVRVDFNSEVDRRGRVRDATRIRAVTPTIVWLLKKKATVILVAHRGRPTGVTPALSLRPFVGAVEQAMRKKVVFLTEPLGSVALKTAVRELKPGSLALLENIRFDRGEEKNSAKTAKNLVQLADVFVLDAFADAHRAHASIVGIRRYKPVYAGLLMAAEIHHLDALMRAPKRPFVAVIGGAKISTKLGVVKKLLKVADHVLLGGALANTMLQAEGVAIGASLSEPSMLKAAKGIRASTAKLEIPIDVVVKNSRGKIRTTAVANVKAHEKIVDVGRDTIDLFSRAITIAKTIVWNGPLGTYEVPPFNKGTIALARVIGKRKVTAVAGGGETLDAISRAKATSGFSFLSTGGGAMLEYLEGKTLPGVRAVQK